MPHAQAGQARIPRRGRGRQPAVRPQRVRQLPQRYHNDEPEDPDFDQQPDLDNFPDQMEIEPGELKILQPQQNPQPDLVLLLQQQIQAQQ